MNPIPPPMRRVLSALLAALALAAPAAAAEERLPIFDTHVHYSSGAWEPFPPARIMEILDAAGVVRALVSSTPDDGTLMLHEAAPARVVPILRPYRTRADMADWFRSDEVLAYLEERLARGVHRGVGEFHLMDPAHAETPQMRRLVALAAARGLVLEVHSGAAPIRALFAIEPGVKILWAHAGMSEPPETVGALLDAHASLWTEVSFRAGEIAPGGGALDPAWRALLLRHADRFMIGTDTYVTPRWESYGELIAQHRTWLAQLPPETARAIAFDNAARLFGM